tara:strand:- start:1990 stop:2808 length:819 start_codon:yes stop_codon:yes gene_type:complete
MKTVFTNSEIVHAFNQQDQTEGRTPSGGMYFYNKKLYSYGSHYLLCEFIDENTVIINNDGYSVSTSKHIGLITGATRNRRQFFTTNIGAENVLNQIESLLKLIPRARKRADEYKATISTLYTDYMEYMQYVKPKLTKEEKKNHRKLAKIMLAFNNDFQGLQETVSKQLKLSAAKAKREVIKALKDWKSGKTQWFRNNTGKDYLRLTEKHVETSQSVKVPILEAKRLLKLIELNKIRGAKVDDKYTVNSFNQFLNVGCHSISIKEINYIKGII